ncbi:MAG TPA: ribokinase [Candidatus Limnocylindrales bacterium]
MSGRVIVVGSVNVDLVVRAPRLPVPGETVTGGVFEQHHGGKGANQAVAAARLGRPTLFVGAVGTDAFGGEALAALGAAGVDTSSVAVIPDAATGVAAILVDDQGENLIAVASGANGLVDTAAVRAAFRRLGSLDGDVVLVSHEIPTATARAALQMARAEGGRTILNPAPAAGLDRTTYGLADIITPNRYEAAMLAGIDRTKQPSDYGRVARRLLDGGGAGPGVREAVIVTLGGAGALLVSADAPDAPIVLPPYRVDPVDTTGAGDAFVGALAAALAEGRDLSGALRRALVAGALATTKPGAREGMPTRVELDAATGDEPFERRRSQEVRLEPTVRTDPAASAEPTAPADPAAPSEPTN